MMIVKQQYLDCNLYVCRFNDKSGKCTQLKCIVPSKEVLQAVQQSVYGKE